MLPSSTVLTPWSRVLAYIQDVWRCRYFWISLVQMDVRTRYRRSVLGVAWSLVHPIAMTAVLCTVFHTMFGMGIKEYGPFLLSGLTFWSYFTFVLIQGCQCFQQGETYIRQYPAPLAIYPLRTVLGAGFHYLLALVVVLVLAWGCAGWGNLPALVVLLPATLLLAIFGWALALLAGFANVFFPDVRHLLELGLQVLFYATPIIYRPENLQNKGLGWLVQFNPLVSILELVRTPVLTGQFPSAATWTASLCSVALAATLACAVLVRWQKRLIFHL